MSRHGVRTVRTVRTVCTVRTVVAAGALVAACLPALLTPAAAAPITGCTSTSGTIVAVDFAHWGGPIVRGCDTGKPANGIDLLTDEGFRTSGDNHDGPQFICRIGNQAFHSGTQYPTPAQDPCIVTPPASAYWSYWLAPAGQDERWTYSQRGAYSEQPKAGAVELWIFGGTDIAGTQGVPTCSPASVRASGSTAHCSSSRSPGRSAPHTTPPPARKPKPKPTPKPTPRSSTSADQHRVTGAADGRTSTPGRGGQVSGSDPTSPADRATSGTGSAAPGRRPATTPAGATLPGEAASSPGGYGQQFVDAKPAAARTSAHGSAVPLVVGVGLAAVLAAAGGVTTWRRRQHSE